MSNGFLFILLFSVGNNNKDLIQKLIWTTAGSRNQTKGNKGIVYKTLGLNLIYKNAFRHIPTAPLAQVPIEKDWRRKETQEDDEN